MDRGDEIRAGWRASPETVPARLGTNSRAASAITSPTTTPSRRPRPPRPASRANARLGRAATRRAVDLYPIPLLGHRQVAAAEPRLDVRHGQPGRHRRTRSREGGVRVTEDDHPVGPLELQHAADAAPPDDRRPPCGGRASRRARPARARRRTRPTAPRRSAGPEWSETSSIARLAQGERERRRLDELRPIADDDGEGLHLATPLASRLADKPILVTGSGSITDGESDWWLTDVRTGADGCAAAVGQSKRPCTTVPIPSRKQIAVTVSIRVRRSPRPSSDHPLSETIATLVYANPRLRVYAVAPGAYVNPVPQQMTERPRISIVIPCYRDEDSVPVLFERIGPVMDALGAPAELILVDDGSPDRTALRAIELGTGLPPSDVGRAPEPELRPAPSGLRRLRGESRRRRRHAGQRPPVSAGADPEADRASRSRRVPGRLGVS